MIDSRTGMRVAHLLGHRKKPSATSAKTKAAAATPRPRPPAPPPARPQPRAKSMEFVLPPEPKLTAAERKAAIAGAMAAMREGDAYLQLLERDDELAAFGARWERVAAEIEGRPVNTQHHRAPPQPALTPMSNEQFSKMFARVQRVLEGG